MAWRSGRLVAAILATSGFATVASAEGPWEPDLRVSTEERKYGPVALKCPEDENGTIEEIKGNRKGIFGRLRVGYEGGVGVLAVTDARLQSNPDFGQAVMYDLKDLEPELLNVALKLIDRGNTKLIDRGNTLLNEVCKKALDEASIRIPFPQQDVHLVPTEIKTTKKKK